jgi:ankyrin repeat protein
MHLILFASFDPLCFIFNYFCFSRAGLTPLHCAAQQGSLGAVLALLNALQADAKLVDACDLEHENTALHYAGTPSRWISCIMFFSFHSFHVDSFPFPFLAQSVALDGNLEILALLLAAGANPTTVNKNGMTDIHSLLFRFLL